MKYNYLLLFLIVPAIYGMEDDPGDEDLIDNPYKGRVRCVEEEIRLKKEQERHAKQQKMLKGMPVGSKKKSNHQLPYESPSVPDDCPS